MKEIENSGYMTKNELHSLAEKGDEVFYSVVNKHDPKIPPSLYQFALLTIYENFDFTPHQVIEEALSFDTWKQPTEIEQKEFESYHTLWPQEDRIQYFFYDTVRKRIRQKYNYNSDKVF